MNNINNADNPVFSGIQPCLLDLIGDTSTSKVLYANKFSGIPVVSMSNDMANLFNSDFGHVGPNMLIQLEKKMSGISGGPWYIDHRDGVIYIHNRNFHDLPIYTYSYKANAGELLDISFKTNYVTKRTSGSMSTGVSYNKGTHTDVVFSNLDMDTLKSSNWQEAKKVQDSKDTAAKKEDEESGKSYNRSLYGTEKVTIDQAYQWYKEGGTELLNKNINQARIEAYFNSMTVSELQVEAESALEQIATNRRTTVAQIRKELKAAMENGTLEQYLKTMYGNSTHTFNSLNNYNPQGGYPSTFSVVEIDVFNYGLTLDIGDISTNYQEGIQSNLGFNQSHSNFSTASAYTGDDGSSSATTQLESWGTHRARLAMRALLNKYKDKIKILEEKPMEASYTSTTSYGVETTTAKYSKKVKVLLESTNHPFEISTRRLLETLFTRQLGEGKTLKDVEAHINSLKHANDSVLEKVITCNMTCVGNPFLESSQVLNLYNLGNVWSGKWYIKSCKHIFNQSGYMCQLSLVQNTVKTTSATASTDVTTIQPWNGEDTYSIRLNVTNEEALYYATEATSDEDKVDFLIRIMYSRSGDNAEEFNEIGIVRVESDTSTTSTGDAVGVTYTIDSRVENIDDETRSKYLLPARAAVINNSFSDIMSRIIEENKQQNGQ